MLDHHIGRLMDYLDQNGLAENTLVVFTSDNGPEHRTVTAFGSSGDLRGAKGHIHEGGIRVPGIVRWPSQISAGQISQEPVNGTDWLPTFSAVAQVDVPTDKPVDGANLLPAFVGNGEVNREIPMMWWLWHARGGYEVAMPGQLQNTRDYVTSAETGRFQRCRATRWLERYEVYQRGRTGSL